MDKPMILTQEQIEEKLKDLPGWKFENDKISKQFEFNDFMDSLKFINDLAPFFEENDHHPDITIMYSKVRFDLQRFDVGGKVTDRDFLVAAEIERRYAQR